MNLSGLIDRHGKEMVLDALHKLVIDKNGYVNFLLKVTEKTDYYISFEVYDVIAWGEDKDTGKYTIPSNVELYLTATIKWDGCSHFWFGEEEDGKQDGYINVCGKHCFEEHIMLMRELYEFGSKNIKCWDDEVAT